MSFPPERNHGCRITTDLTLKGMRSVVLENRALRVTVLVDKGTDIWEFLYKPLDIDFMWRSPMLLRDPRYFIPTSASSFGAWYDYYEGGWQEVLPSGGVPSQYKGAEYGLHGESSIIPWEYRVMEDDPEGVTVAFWTRFYRSPFYVEKRLTLQGALPVLRIEERVTNEGGESMEFMWGHHPTLGEAFLDESCTIDTGAKRVRVLDESMFDSQRLPPGCQFEWPRSQDGVDISRMPPKDNLSADFFLLDDMENGWYAVTNQKRHAGFGMAWQKEVFPYLWFWQVCGGAYEYPWYGRTYNLALEPFSSQPGGIASAIKTGTALKLGAGESLSHQMIAVAFEGQGRVKQLLPDGTIIWE